MTGIEKEIGVIEIPDKDEKNSTIIKTNTVISKKLTDNLMDQMKKSY